MVDEDCDGVNDALEQQHGLDATDPNDGSADPDGDDVPTSYELRLGGDPESSDTDGDGEPDTTDLLTGVDLDGALVRYRNAEGHYAHSSSPEEAAELESQGGSYTSSTIWAGSEDGDRPWGADFDPPSLQHGASVRVRCVRDTGND